jgi:cytochrome P450
MVMCNYPQMQAKAQAEIDSVVGTDRLPTYEDRENLPFLNAFIKELYRFFTVAPLGTWSFLFV